MLCLLPDEILISMGFQPFMFFLLYMLFHIKMHYSHTLPYPYPYPSILARSLVYFFLFFFHFIISLRVILFLAMIFFSVARHEWVARTTFSHFKMPRKLHFMENHFLGNTILNAAITWAAVHLEMFVYCQWQFINEHQNAIEWITWITIGIHSKFLFWNFSASIL